MSNRDSESKLAKKKEGEILSIDHNDDPFWKAYTPLNDKLTKEGKKATKLAYTKPENQWPYENCDTYKGVSAILAPDRKSVV